MTKEEKLTLAKAHFDEGSKLLSEVVQEIVQGAKPKTRRKSATLIKLEHAVTRANARRKQS